MENSTVDEKSLDFTTAISYKNRTVNLGVEIGRTERVGYRAMRKARNSKPTMNVVVNAFSKWCREIDRVKELDIDQTDFTSDANCEKIARRLTEMDIPTSHKISGQTIQRYMEKGFISDLDIAIEVAERTKSVEELRHYLLSRKYTPGYNPKQKA
jgi:hypothetical protein